MQESSVINRPLSSSLPTLEARPWPESAPTFGVYTSLARDDRHHLLHKNGDIFPSWQVSARVVRLVYRGLTASCVYINLGLVDQLTSIHPFQHLPF